MTENKRQPAEKPQEEPDIKERIEGFDKELRPLLGKYELGLTAQAFLLPDGRIGSQPILISIRGKVKSENSELSKPE